MNTVAQVQVVPPVLGELRALQTTLMDARSAASVLAKYAAEIDRALLTVACGLVALADALEGGVGDE